MCQAAHAAHEAGIRFGDPHCVSSIVVCPVDNEHELLKAQWRIARKGIRMYVFREPDIGGQATALATEPIAAGLRKVFSKYRLWLPDGQPAR